MDLSLVLPVYNEVDNLKPLLQEINNVFAEHTLQWEVIFVDDGSRDGSDKVLLELGEQQKNIKVITFGRNYGQAAAFDAGFQHASGKITVTMDSDLQNDPKDIFHMIELLDQGYDMVSGWRKKRRDNVFIRNIPSWIANWIIRKLTGTKLHDMGCSLKVYRTKVIQDVRLYGEMHRFISVLVENIGGKTTEVPVNQRARTAGKSKYGISRTFKVILDLLNVWFLQKFQTKPIHIFGGMGMWMLFVGFLAGSLALYQKLHLGVWVHRNPVFLIAMILTVVGFQFIATGLLAETIMRTYYESRDKTSYRIARQSGFLETNNEAVPVKKTA